MLPPFHALFRRQLPEHRQPPRHLHSPPGPREANPPSGDTAAAAPAGVEGAETDAATCRAMAEDTLSEERLNALLVPYKTPRASSSWTGLAAGLAAGQLLRTGAASGWLLRATRGHLGAPAGAALLGALLNSVLVAVNVRLEQQDQRMLMLDPPLRSQHGLLCFVKETTEPLTCGELAVAAAKGALVGTMAQKFPQEMMISALMVTAGHLWLHGRDAA